MVGELSFFEIGVGDAAQGRAFYEGLFGWRFDPSPSGTGFALQAPNVPGGMHGGDAGVSPYLFFRVHDIDEAVDKVRQLGGEVDDVNVEGDADSIARFGRFRMCRDDQGSAFGLHQPPTATS